MEIRLATSKDLDSITFLHCNSFTAQNHVPMIFGPKYVKATYKWLITSNKSYVLIATINDELAGVVSVCDGAFTKDMFLSCLPEFFLSVLANPTIIFNKLLWKRLYRKPESQENAELEKLPNFAQMTIGIVDSKFRGKGVFGELIEMTKVFSKERGSKLIRSGIYKINTSSRKTFINAGWPELTKIETEDTVFYGAFLDIEYYTLFFEN